MNRRVNDIRPAIDELADVIAGWNANPRNRLPSIKVGEDWTVGIAWLVKALRKVLDRHAPDRDGNCVACYRSSSSGWYQRRPWPCDDVIDIATELDLQDVLGIDAEDA
ncbi:hypothetical protein [Amycolatopsis taiwanensis]|uniref:hypothetical protein n=1 Tax=Amycolatopsis taiwanensis TaxID=342230 RepID=UPI0004892181|nr:hypothetical protein [Amycolatopsis taiwanensis]